MSSFIDSFMIILAIFGQSKQLNWLPATCIFFASPSYQHLLAYLPEMAIKTARVFCLRSVGRAHSNISEPFFTNANSK